MINNRQNKILEILEKNDQTSVIELTEKLNVSSVTIRQDLNFLATEGLLKRVHGGAVLKDADDLTNRLGVNYEKKLRIAKKVATFVNEGETILIESGSVNVLLARELLKIKKVTIITTNVYIARQFRKNEQANIIILGGIYQHDSETLVGKITKTCIEQINIDKAFIGIDGYETDSGFTLYDLFRAEISSYIIQKAKDVFIVSDSSKFGKTELTNICYTADIQHIATNNELDVHFQNEFNNAGVDLILA
ncbi:MAG: DeoR/GlpR transcriptional regulator [Prolixibacteraceae bacterium]|jgi:DeoR/GlpR family transcriptional regulator of sugar metabolism|nr:DeoR/GlpR transcriptional regulator [Prolixibacteraceae bacterium]MBT6005829.1 DeoR/GlpR transcriptional regulator [Prolixibacteraceae bacterium]MBT6764765.1 DeoR/GlpR transcriptional regulator [Prolixibacteraceae bacterium]MBT6996836.1 DeoR/GlpR transcriptional regulator [Prolixibacteraceae bacterium]MBT7395281.1 DeoR/GlpR transcriptional regulator [Prolixibacteraceae bacterium]